MLWIQVLRAGRQIRMTQSALLIFGLGYTGRAIAAAARDAGFAVTATSRDPSAQAPIAGVRVIPFGAAAGAAAAASHVLTTVPPSGDGGEGEAIDPVWHGYGEVLAASSVLRWAGFMSTTGVYGHHGTGWVDETTPATPGQERSQRRLAAEHLWARLGARVPVDLFRIAGIYGPGRSVLAEVRAGRARRVIKPGQMFCRIHRDDITAAVLAAMRQERPPGARVLNLSDDEPAESAAVIEEAARLLGADPPPEVRFAEIEAQMSPIARSFWQESRRVRSAVTQQALGLRWRYPTYREGLRAVLDAEAQGEAT
jgi:nucleoside-diphosphate-sugar epimerase